jgi:MSHA biogenesis protein MshQ
MNKKSFTLIELLVVIAIIGILSSLVIARFSDTRDGATISNSLQWSSGVHRLLGHELAGHWNFDHGSGAVCGGKDVCDLSGYGNHGTNSGGVWKCESVDTPNGEGCSMEFDQNGNEVILSSEYNSLIMGWSSFTISAWIKTEAVYAGSHISGHIFQRRRGSTPPCGYILGINNNNLLFFLRDDSENSVTVYSNSSANDGKWNLVVAVYDRNNNQAKIYINGRVDKTQSTSIISNSFNYSLEMQTKIGSHSSSFHNFDGLIDDVRVYRTALSSEEISRIYAETKDKYLVYE